jgi:hypothetical protein
MFIGSKIFVKSEIVIKSYRNAGPSASLRMTDIYRKP